MLVENFKHQDPAAVINSYVGDYEGHPSEIKHAYDQLIDKFTYQGDMYRVHIHGMEAFGDVKDSRALLTKLQQHEQTHGDLIQSWSKTLKGLQDAMYTNIESGLYDDFDLAVGVVLKQNGRGLDVVPVLETLPKDDVMYLALHHGEQEVLAKVRNVEIEGFFMHGAIYKDFKQFLRKVQEYKNRSN